MCSTLKDMSSPGTYLASDSRSEDNVIHFGIRCIQESLGLNGVSQSAAALHPSACSCIPFAPKNIRFALLQSKCSCTTQQETLHVQLLCSNVRNSGSVSGVEVLN